MPTHRESVAAGGHVIGPARPTEPVALTPYDPVWPERYEVMRARLDAALGDVAKRIDHVGSTAVPGLAAKPVVDIQVSVADVTDEDAYRDAIESQGFILRWIEPHHRYFRPPPGLPREYQVHVCALGSNWERIHLLFRDYLRAHPETAAEYAALKAKLVAQYPHDRIGYTDAKGPFIDGVVAIADEWARQSGWRLSQPGVSFALRKREGTRVMDFGFTLKPDHTIQRTIALAQQAEAGGFGHGWLFDSHVLWKDPYPLLTVMALNTQSIRMGTCVTNPATREPSVTASALAALNEISDGRMDLGIGRGDSARRVMGKPPTTLARLEEATNLIRDLVEGRAVDQEGTELRLTWTRGDKLPVWIAGYGPKALELTARIADGVILQLADVDLIRWFVGQLRDFARQHGRDPNAIKVMAAAPAHVGAREDCRDRVRWFPALVSNHVVDLVSKYDPADIPAGLTAYVRDREGYNYLHHAEVGSNNSQFVTDEVVDRFCVIGTVDEHLQKLAELADAGVDQFNIYLMNGDEEETLATYSREIIPRVKDLAATQAR